MKKQIIALIGLGYWGTIVANTVVSMNKFRKIYIYDTNKEKVKNLKNKFASRVEYLSFEEIKKNNEIKNIFLATHTKNNLIL